MGGGVAYSLNNPVRFADSKERQQTQRVTLTCVVWNCSLTCVV